MDKRSLKKPAKRNVVPNGLDNIFALFAQLENLSLLLQEFQPMFARVIELMDNSNQNSTAISENQETPFHEKLNELISITQETRENSAFVKRIFTQEKPKKTKVKVDKSEAVNEYLLKYNKSMKL